MRVLKALVITLLIYALLIWLLVTQYAKMEIIPLPKNDHVIKINIQNIIVPPVPKPVVVKPIIKKEQVAVKKPIKKVVKKEVIKKEPIKKTVVKKEVVKKKPIEKTPPKKTVLVKKAPSEKKVHVPKKPKEKKPEEKKVVKKKSEALEAFERDMVYIPEPMMQPKKNQAQSSDLGSFLSTPSTPTMPKAYPNSKIKNLYGSEFHTFTPTQKKFIEDNLNVIQQITQRTLTQRGYPEGAGRTGQEGTNVVSFNLHPNGDISGLRLKTRIGYRALDDNTLTLIKVAYKDYPYPSTTTKIVFYVTYSIYGY